MLKKIVCSMMVLVVLVGCGQAKVTQFEDPLQDDPKLYGEPEVFAFQNTFDYFPDQAVPQNSLCQTVEACRQQGDDYLKQLYGDSIEKIDDLIKEEGQSEPLTQSSDQDGEIKMLATYQIHLDDQLELKSGSLTDEQWSVMAFMYTLFIDLVPKSWRENVVEVQAFDSQNFAAYINYDETDMTKQVIGLNTTDISYLSVYDIQETLIHELAHLFSLKLDQFNGEICNNPLGDTLDCSKPDSYINLYYQAFWSMVDENWRDNSRKEAEASHRFFELNEDNFVSSYASNNVYEDFAESFRYFVLIPKPEDQHTPLNQKVAFFYQYPELVQLRAELLHNMMGVAEGQ